MFYILEIDDYVRVEPELFSLQPKEAIKKQLEKQFQNYVDEELGFVIKVLDVSRVGEGILIPEDPAAYYDSTFSLLVFKPLLHELVFGEVTKITNFGAFINIGVTEAMIHISQTMDDFVSFSKSNALIGRNSKRSLKKGDLCLARIIAISYKVLPPKIGLTMRQIGLGKIEWIEEEKRKSKIQAEKTAKAETKAKEKKEK
ncbi:MAG: DNA-directed RNA polymerase [Candidatus Pacearchaeota archaeon]|nr:DNA-directed RNA polymerase [Candidatus Pacearchaeota archaeon]